MPFFSSLRKIVTSDEKIHQDVESKAAISPAVTAVQSPDTNSDSETTSDGDDALKLTGTQMHHFDEAYYRKLRRRIDLHVMPLLVFTYFSQYLDKNILGYASIMGFPITDVWYNHVAQAF